MKSAPYSLPGVWNPGFRSPASTRSRIASAVSAVVVYPSGPRNQLVQGTWDSTAVLLEAGGAIEATAKKLPYVGGF